MATRFVAALKRWPAGVAAGPFIYFSGQRGTFGADGLTCERFEQVADIAPGPESRYAWVNRIEGPVGAQTIAIYERYRALLGRQGGDLRHLVRFHLFQRDKRFFPAFDRIRRHNEPSAPTPSTAVGMGRFDTDDSARFCVDAIALDPRAETKFGGRAAISAADQPAAAASYSHVMGAGPFRFIAGQIPIDTTKPGAPLVRGYDDIPAAGHFLRVGRSHEDTRNGPIAAQTWFTYDLIRKHLEGAGSSLANVLNVTVYLQDMRDFPTFHRLHERFFPDDPPALTVIEASEVGHKGTLIEIEPTALATDAPFSRRAISSPGNPAPAHMSAVVEAGGTAFVSGMLGLDDHGELATNIAQVPARYRLGLKKDAAAVRNPAVLQALMALARIDQALSLADARLARTAHLTVFLKDIADFLAMEPFIAKALGARQCAITVVEAPNPGPIPGARVAMTAIAWLGEAAPRLLE